MDKPFAVVRQWDAKSVIISAKPRRFATEAEAQAFADKCQAKLSPQSLTKFVVVRTGDVRE